MWGFRKKDVCFAWETREMFIFEISFYIMVLLNKKTLKGIASRLTNSNKKLKTKPFCLLLVQNQKIKIKIIYFPSTDTIHAFIE
jgi:hypothetical protein